MINHYVLCILWLTQTPWKHQRFEPLGVEIFLNTKPIACGKKQNLQSIFAYILIFFFNSKDFVQKQQLL